MSDHNGLSGAQLERLALLARVDEAAWQEAR